VKVNKERFEPVALARHSRGEDNGTYDFYLLMK